MSLLRDFHQRLLTKILYSHSVLIHLVNTGLASFRLHAHHQPKNRPRLDQAQECFSQEPTLHKSCRMLFTTLQNDCFWSTAIF